MVIVVAAILSSAASFLKPFQEQNVRTEKIMNILKAVSIETEKKDADDTYQKYIVEEYTISRDGEVMSVYRSGTMEQGEVRAFDIDLKVELKKNADLKAGKGTDEPLFPMFVCQKDGDTFYVIPLRGSGLWGPVWGNLAVGDDFRTVYGANFDHQGETPGLGAEISTPIFQDQFPGKTIFDEDYNFTSIRVVKGGASVLPQNEQVHAVDGISGGTITSNGVDDMLRDCLENYVPYIKKQI
jgi:Na+-transporting NADH:ubiquinone oxidoreductase subunit C